MIGLTARMVDQDGLFNLQSAFLDSVKTILRKHGTDHDEYVDVYELPRSPDDDVSQFETINRTAKFAEVETDVDLLFLDLMFTGDLIQGLKMVIRLFKEETRDLMDAVHVEIRLLFGVYLAFVSCCPTTRRPTEKGQEKQHCKPLCECACCADAHALSMTDSDAGCADDRRLLLLALPQNPQGGPPRGRQGPGTRCAGARDALLMVMIR